MNLLMAGQVVELLDAGLDVVARDALALGDGGEFRAPMAIAVIGGLITSTVLSLLVIPVVYSLLEGLRMGVSTRWRKWRGMA